jgi:hypothetical protein
MTTRTPNWLDPSLDRSLPDRQFPFNYLQLLVEYFFEIVVLIVVYRIYHLRDTGGTLEAVGVANQIRQALGEPAPDPDAVPPTSPDLTPNQEVQLLVAQCLGIVPLSEATIWQLRQVSFVDRKNAYRRMRDAIEVLSEVQLLLLALAFKDDQYEEFFALDLQLPSIDPPEDL